MLYSYKFPIAPSKEEFNEFLSIFPSDLSLLIKNNICLNYDLINFELPLSIYKAIKHALYVKANQKKSIYNNPFFVAWISVEASVDSQNSLLENQRLLLKKAENFYQKFTGYRFSQPIIESKLTYENLLEILLNKEKMTRIVVGESHGEFGPLIFIINNIKLLSEKKAIVVLENLCDSLQEELDSCFENKKLSSLVEIAIPIVKDANYQESARLKIKMVRLLLENGIRIIAGENEISNAFTDANKKDRVKVMNYVMPKIVNDYLENQKIITLVPIIYIVGRSHALKNKDYLGITELTQGTYINIEDNKKIENHKVEFVNKNDKCFQLQFSLKEYVASITTNKNFNSVLMPYSTPYAITSSPKKVDSSEELKEENISSRNKSKFFF